MCQLANLNGRVGRVAIGDAILSVQTLPETQVDNGRSCLITGDEITPERKPNRAAWVKNGLRRRGVLVGCTGPNDCVLKVRPPLAFTVFEVPIFVAALEAALEDPMPTEPDRSTASETSIRDAVALAAKQHHVLTHLTSLEVN